MPASWIVHLDNKEYAEYFENTIFGKTLENSRAFLAPPISSFVEKVFDLGKLILVPDLPDKPPVIEIGAWIVKRYKIWIIDPTWDLHNKRVEFRSPRARYLYFHYSNAIDTLKSEMGKPAWTTLGYMSKRILRPLVEELGHDYQHLMQGQSCN